MRRRGVAPACAVLIAVTAAAGPARGVPDLRAVVARLRHAHVSVADEGEIEQPFFSVAGRAYKIGTADVQMFEFGDQAKAKKAAASVSPDGSTIDGASPLWVAPPHFYRLGRVIALYLGNDAATLALLKDVFGAPFAAR